MKSRKHHKIVLQLPRLHFQLLSTNNQQKCGNKPTCHVRHFKMNRERKNYLQLWLGKKKFIKWNIWMEKELGNKETNSILCFMLSHVSWAYFFSFFAFISWNICVCGVCDCSTFAPCISEINIIFMLWRGVRGVQVINLQAGSMTQHSNWIIFIEFQKSQASWNENSSSAWYCWGYKIEEIIDVRSRREFRTMKSYKKWFYVIFW